MASARFGNTETRHNRIQRAIGAGVRGVAVPSFGPDDWDAIITPHSAHVPRLPEFPGLTWVRGLGIHPWWLKDHDDAEAQRALGDLASRLPGAAFVGECGLDYLRRGPSDRARQVRLLRSQLHLAREHKLPCVLHCVRAHQGLLALLDEVDPPASILHGFSGSAELANEFVRRGHFISFCGSVTLPQARKIHAAARAVPNHMLLLETDSPDQTPVNRRPAQNEPAFIVDVARQVAGLRGQSLHEIAALSLGNAHRAFGLGAELAG